MYGRNKHVLLLKFIFQYGLYINFRTQQAQLLLVSNVFILAFLNSTDLYRYDDL